MNIYIVGFLSKNLIYHHIHKALKPPTPVHILVFQRQAIRRFFVNPFFYRPISLQFFVFKKHKKLNLTMFKIIKYLPNIGFHPTVRGQIQQLSVISMEVLCTSNQRNVMLSTFLNHQRFEPPITKLV